MVRYSPMSIFPLFVLVVVMAGIIYTVSTKSQFENHSLAQVHIVQPSPNTDHIIPPTGTAKVELLHPLPELRYPETTTISESPNSIRLESMINTETITNWYKQKIRELGYDSKSFVNANSNGNIENRLMGTKDNNELYIEIKKPNGFIKTAINIEINN